MYQSLMDGVDSRVSAGKSFAATFGGHCPDYHTWPNCWIPYVTFDKVTRPLTESLNMRSTGMLPIVYPYQVSSFEKFAKVCYQNDSYPPSTGFFSFGFGISAKNEQGERYHDTTGYNPSSKYQLLVPSFEYGKEVAETLLVNAHAISSRQIPLDEIISCYHSAVNTSSCTGAVTDFIQLAIDNQTRPASSVYHAINPANNRSALVGFTAVIINWDTVLGNGAPSVMSNIFAVLDSGQSQYTYYFKEGRAVYKGIGDLHQRRYHHMRRRFAFLPSGSTTSAYNYSVSFYPSQEFYDTYHTQTPFYVCLVSLLIVLGTSIIFLVYDFFVKREALEQTRILEAKQTYVRFISHVRSPGSLLILSNKSHFLFLGNSNSIKYCVFGNASNEK
jgi:hypothetical protein